MTLQSVLDQIQTGGWDALAGGHRRGDYALPAAFIKPYDALQRLADAAPPAVAPDAAVTVQEAADKLAATAMSGKRFPLDVGALSGTRASAQDVADWRLARDVAADALLSQMSKAIGYVGADLIRECIQPAFAARMETFTADLAILGPHALKDSPDIALLAETDDVRHAYLRHYDANVWYSPLRTAWSILRRHDAGVLHDPNGTHSLFGEIANADKIAPDHWKRPQRADRGELHGPWPSHATPARLAWIVRNGGQLWMPTAAEQQQAYEPHMPDPTPYYLRSGANRSPYAAINAMAGRQPAA